MRQTIKVKRIREVNLPKFIEKGEWIDLESAESVSLKAPSVGKLTSSEKEEREKRRKVSFDSKLIPLGIAMQLPGGYEAIVAPRSSLFSKKGIIMTNSLGVIDNSYNSDSDEWKFPALAIKDTKIEANTRICQFRIQLSQKATFWQKLKWLFTEGFDIVEVDTLNNDERGGFGSTGY